MSTEDEDEKKLRIMVVEDRQFQRRLIAETLRAVRDLSFEYAESAEDCLLMLASTQPDMLVTDWDIEGGKGLDLVRRIRRGEAGDEARSTPIVMVTTRNTEQAVRQARNAGVDEFVLRPFSTSILTRRAKEVRDHKRDFIESVHYLGPCRRRRNDEHYIGPKRRDAETKNQADAPELQRHKGVARAQVEQIAAMLRALDVNDGGAIGSLRDACAELKNFAVTMGEPMIQAASSSLYNYVDGCAVAGKLGADVVQAHIDALLQLVQLPNYQIELRQTVTQQLGVMVAKKLRQTGAAA
ncbi:MAG TPA: response regulator [Terricaulis sp.]|nr:response regulator [Terricaulis sp.]